MQALLGAQAAAGNRVATLLVQRWEADEHELLGNKGSANRTVQLAPGYVITFGEMVALAGDHFESIAQMRRFAANTKGGPGSRAEIDYAREWQLGAKGMRYDDKAKAAQEARYYALAGGNRSHFLNPGTGDAALDPATRAGDPRAYLDPKYTTAPANASQAYRLNHVRAIAEAVEAAHRKGATDSALATEAFGAHFLTDAFSAGHVRTPREGAKEYWDAKVPMFVHNMIGFMAQEVAKNLGTWQKKVVPTDVTMRQDMPVFGALAKVKDKLATKRFTFGDMVGLALHDWDNAHGLAATVHGADVHLGGDDHLTDADNDAMPYAIKAVHEGVQEIEQAFALGHQGKDVSAVLDSLLGKDRLFEPERWLPVAKPDAAQAADSRSIPWRFPDVFSLLADTRFQEAVKLFLKVKKGELEKVLKEFEPDQQEAFRKGVLDRLDADAIGTLTAVVQWVPSLTQSKPWEAQSAGEYVHAAEKQPGGPASLTLHQRVRLVNKLFFHPYGGKRELLLLLTSAADDDARKLIRTFGWERLHAFVDERATPFANRFPRREYAR